MLLLPIELDTAGNVRFSTMRSPRFWVSGYRRKWRIQGSFTAFNRLAKIKQSVKPSLYVAQLSDLIYTDLTLLIRPLDDISVAKFV